VTAGWNPCKDPPRGLYKEQKPVAIFKMLGSTGKE